MTNSYADIDTDLERLLHEVARLHIHLAKLSDVKVSIKGWKYNELITSIIVSNNSTDLAVK